ncbi:mobile mystery protein A [Sphingomonas sp. PWP1-2]|uniref:mobile mystery protein A n=1 Tax=Sphingomonas sp. PWP1-2 TaxID=2804558 RepID=UPI003CF74100
MKKEITDRARKRLDERLTALGPAERFAVPPRGWIRAIRDALGMSGSQLGQRIGITAQSVQNLETSEVSGTVQLNTLRKAAEAMDCVLVYALIPKSSLARTMEQRERAIAIEALRRVSHSMALEDQRVADTEDEARIQRYIATSLRQRDIWNKP